MFVGRLIASDSKVQKRYFFGEMSRRLWSERYEELPTPLYGGERLNAFAMRTVSTGEILTRVIRIETYSATRSPGQCTVRENNIVRSRWGCFMENEI